MDYRRIAPDDVLDTLRRRIQVDGLDLVLDLERSKGVRLFDARDGKEYLDFFSFFAANPLGMNHPEMLEPRFLERLGRVAVNKPSNSDVYSEVFAEFVDAVDRIARPACMKYFFFVDGGALAVENALKVAFDWKVRRNFAKGLTVERGHEIMHFQWAFHGRSGYTLSLTNTVDPRKTMYFPKFDWPRLPAPAISFPLDEAENRRLDQLESDIIEQARGYFRERPDAIAAILIEPIQCEGGDRHFRPTFLRALRELADEHDALLIFDEVQTGVGMTGRFWAFEHFGVEPDIICFAKKMQIGGIMAGPRVDVEPDNVFHVSSRINSTWGGHIVDMLRASRILQVIENEGLVANSAKMGERLLQGLAALAKQRPELVGNVRGRGLLCAIDFPNGATRDAVVRTCHEDGLLILPCGTRSMRFRPALNVTASEVDEALARVDAILARSAFSAGMTETAAP